MAISPASTRTMPARNGARSRSIVWRRSYDVAPPGGESLKDTLARALPYYMRRIQPDVLSGKTVLVAAHGNSLRALIMAIEGLAPDEILKRELDTGVPIVYELGADSRPLVGASAEGLSRHRHSATEAWGGWRVAPGAVVSGIGVQMALVETPHPSRCRVPPSALARGGGRIYLYGSAASRRPSPRKLKARMTRITGMTGIISQG